MRPTPAQTLEFEAAKQGLERLDMGRLDYKLFYKRNLPHFQPTGTTLFVTFRLTGSIPQAVLRRWAQEDVLAERERRSVRYRAENAPAQKKLAARKRFMESEELLHRQASGPIWLREDRIAEVVTDALRFRDGEVFRLDSYTVMPILVHVVFAPLPANSDEDHSLASIMHSLKSYTARESNKKLNRRGKFWEHENYDHAVREKRMSSFA